MLTINNPESLNITFRRGDEIFAIKYQMEISDSYMFFIMNSKSEIVLYLYLDRKYKSSIGLIKLESYVSNTQYQTDYEIPYEIVKDLSQFIMYIITKVFKDANNQ